MVVFNQTGFSNLTNVTQIFDVADVFTAGTLGVGIWIMLTFGTFFTLSRYNTNEGLIAASFVSLISALFLAYLGMLSGVFVMVGLTLFAIIIVLSIVLKGGMGGA